MMEIVLVGATLIFAAALLAGMFALAKHNHAASRECDDEAAMVENSEQQRAYTIVRGGNIETETE